MSDQILTIKDVALRLRMSDGGVRDLERRGLLHTQRTVSGVRLFSGREVEELAAKRDAARDARQVDVA